MVAGAAVVGSGREFEEMVGTEGVEGKRRPKGHEACSRMQRGMD